MEKRANMLTRVSDVIETITVWINVAIMAILSVNLVAAVMFRYFLNSPIYWADELSLILFAWITFLGGSIGLKRSMMASVTLLEDRFKGTPLFLLKLVSQISIVLFGAVVGVYSWKWLTSEGVLNQMATTLPVPLWVTFAALPVSMVLIVLFGIDNLMKLLQTGGTPPVKEETAP